MFQNKVSSILLEKIKNYYAWVPKGVNIPNMYEVKIESVDVRKFYNEQIRNGFYYM